MPRLILPALLAIACGDGKPGGDSGNASADGGQDVDCPTPSTWYIDADGDGYGAGDPVGEGCVRPDGQVADDDDCDDGDPGTPDGRPQGRVDFWSGPASGDLSMDDADSLEYSVSAEISSPGACLCSSRRQQGKTGRSRRHSGRGSPPTRGRNMPRSPW